MNIPYKSIVIHSLSTSLGTAYKACTARPSTWPAFRISRAASLEILRTASSKDNCDLGSWESPVLSQREWLGELVYWMVPQMDGCLHGKSRWLGVPLFYETSACRYIELVDLVLSTMVNPNSWAPLCSCCVGRYKIYSHIVNDYTATYIWGAHHFAFVSHAACIWCMFSCIYLILLCDVLVLDINVGERWESSLNSDVNGESGYTCHHHIVIWSSWSVQNYPIAKKCQKNDFNGLVQGFGALFRSSISLSLHSSWC